MFTLGKMDEEIIVVERDKLFDSERLEFQGLLTGRTKVKEITDNIDKHFKEMRRGDAEENTEYKQPIPYVIVRQGDKIFTYERLSGGGEERLHNQLSIGVGGHMNVESDSVFSAQLVANMNRELEEELIIDHKGEFKLITVGIINDDENEVGQVHIGLLVILELQEGSTVKVREEDTLAGEWFTVEELEIVSDQLESWSQIALEAITE